MDVQRMIGLCLVMLRKERGLTQDALSEATEIKRTAISAYENGSRSPSIKNLLRILEGLDATLWDLARVYDGVDVGKREPERTPPPKPRLSDEVRTDLLADAIARLEALEAEAKRRRTGG